MKNFTSSPNALWPLDIDVDPKFSQRVQDIDFYTLGNGLRVLQTHDERDRSFFIKLFVNAGSIHQDPQKRGIPHYHEHMVFKGTEKYPDKQKLQELAEDFNLSKNAYTGGISQAFHALADADIDSAKVACEYISQVVFHPIFPEKEALLERDVIMSERKMYNSDPWDCLWELGNDHFLGDNHPLGGGGVLGSEADIESFNVQDVIDHHEQLFHPENMLIQVSSGLKPAEIKDLVTKYFDIQVKNKPSWTSNPMIGELRQTKVRNSHLDKEFDAMYMQVCYYIPKSKLDFPDLKSFALSLVSYVLSKRIFKDLRNDQGLAYAIGATTDEVVHGTNLLMYGQFAEDKYVTAKEQMLGYLDKFIGEPITEAEFNRAMRNRNSIRWADSAKKVLSSVAENYFKYGVFISPEADSDYYEQIDLKYLNSFVQTELTGLTAELLEVGHIN